MDAPASVPAEARDLQKRTRLMLQRLDAARQEGRRQALAECSDMLFALIEQSHTHASSAMGALAAAYRILDGKLRGEPEAPED